MGRRVGLPDAAVEGGVMSLTIVGWLLLGGFLTFCFWRILEKAGQAPWMAFLVFVPVAGQLFLIVWLAFTRWPAVDDPDAGERSTR